MRQLRASPAISHLFGPGQYHLAVAGGCVALGPAEMTRAFLKSRALLLQDFSCLHGPENQIELVEIYTDVASEMNQLLLNFEVLPSC